MLKIPYEKNPGNACALACYTMTSRYFFPEVTFKQIANISNWSSGYIVWAFKFWLWIMNKGIKIINYDIINLQNWAENGVDGLGENISKKELRYYIKNTKNINMYSNDIKKILAHPNFMHKQKLPTWDNLLAAYKGGAVCEVTLNSNFLDQKDGFDVHRVIIIDIEKNNIFFHDPRKNKILPKRKESIELFKKAWLDKMEGTELCIYNK